MPPQRQRVLRSCGRGHLVSQRRGNRAEPGALLPEQLTRIGPGPVQQGELYQQLRPDVPAMHHRRAQPAWSLLEIMTVSAGGWTIEAAAQVAALEEDRAIELPEALARHCLIQLVREACRHVLTVRPAAGLALLGAVPKVSGPRAMFLFLDRVGDIFDIGNASALWAGPVAGSRDCYLLPKCAGAHPAEPDEAEHLVAAVGFDGVGLITHHDQYLVTAQRYAAGKAHRRGARRMSACGTRRGINWRSAREMDDERFLNSYHNASTSPGPDVPADLAGFMLAADPVLSEAAELSRVLAHAHQGAATQLIGEDWAHARKYFSLSEKYAAWADYGTPARGFGIHAYAHEVHKPIRLTDEELRAHPEWRNFGHDRDRHPPMRGWLAVPLIGSDGVNYGFIQVSDRLEGDFTAQDEANLLRLASLTATALDALAQLHLPEYRAKVADPGQ